LGQLAIQDSFEPYYEGRKNHNIFATIEPGAVEKARKLKERLEQLRANDRDNERSAA
jgi:hypothetical protein